MTDIQNYYPETKHDNQAIRDLKSEIVSKIASAKKEMGDFVFFKGLEISFKHIDSLIRLEIESFLKRINTMINLQNGETRFYPLKEPLKNTFNKTTLDCLSQFLGKFVNFKPVEPPLSGFFSYFSLLRPIPLVVFQVVHSRDLRTLKILPRAKIVNNCILFLKIPR